MPPGPLEHGWVGNLSATGGHERSTWVLLDSAESAEGASPSFGAAPFDRHDLAWPMIHPWPTMAAVLALVDRGVGEPLQYLPPLFNHARRRALAEPEN